jgi:hypothetical protein
MVRYLFHVLAYSVSGEAKKVQQRFISDNFAVGDEKIVKRRGFFRKTPRQLAPVGEARKRKGLRCIFCPLAFMISGFAVPLSSCI